MLLISNSAAQRGGSRGAPWSCLRTACGVAACLFIPLFIPAAVDVLSVFPLINKDRSAVYLSLHLAAFHVTVSV